MIVGIAEGTLLVKCGDTGETAVAVMESVGDGVLCEALAVGIAVITPGISDVLG